MSSVLWCLHDLVVQCYPMSKHCDVYHDLVVKLCHMDVNSTLCLPWHGCSSLLNDKVMWCLPRLVCQQDCDVYRDLRVQLHNVVSTVLCLQWLECWQDCDVYHVLMVHLYPRKSTIMFTMTWMSTGLWCLPWLGGSTLSHGFQQYCLLWLESVNRTVMFTMTSWFNSIQEWTVLQCLPWLDVNTTIAMFMKFGCSTLPHECQQYCDVYHDLVSKLSGRGQDDDRWGVHGFSNQSCLSSTLYQHIQGWKQVG